MRPFSQPDRIKSPEIRFQPSAQAFAFFAVWTDQIGICQLGQHRYFFVGTENRGAITQRHTIIDPFTARHKDLDLGHPEGIAMFMAPFMRLLLVLCAPIVYLFTVSTEMVFRIFGKRFDQQDLVTEEDITILLRQATKAGVFEESETEMVEAVFDLADISARALMTPRTQIIWLDVNDSAQQVREKLSASSHSRFPLCEGSLDNVLGIAQTKDLLGAFLRSDRFDLRATMQPADFVPRTMTALQVLDHIKTSGSHIVLIVDEYGGIEGLLTHHDLLEAIAGEMPLSGPSERRATQRKDGSWLLDGMLAVDEFKDICEVRYLERTPSISTTEIIEIVKKI